MLVCSRIQDMRAIWEGRWNFFHKPIHAMAYVLHPLWRSEDQYGDIELERSWQAYLELHTGGDVEEMANIEDGLLLFRNRESTFGRGTAQLRKSQLEPVSWWEKYGNASPSLVSGLRFIL